MTREEQIEQESYRWFLKDFYETNGGENPDQEDVENAFQRGAEWADQHPQWMPVEERLPKFDEQVLVYGLCPNGCRLFYVDCLIQDINDNGYPKWDDDTIIPTHWMPLPKAPRKEEE